MKYRLFKNLLGLLAGAVIAVFIPVIPVSTANLEDPANPIGPRISAEISQSDLEQILVIVRRGSLNSIYEIIRFHTRQPLLYISPSRPTWHVHPPPARELPPVGEINATVGHDCGKLCGSGVTYYLEKTQGQWRIVKRTEWIS